MRHLFLLLAFLAAPALAETVRLSPNGVNATLSFDERLAAHPAFDAFLREDAIAFAEDAGFDGARAFALEDRATRVDAGYASVLRRSETDYGGALPAVFVEALVWSGAAADFARLDAFFDDGPSQDEALIAISRHLRETIRKRVWGGRIAPAFEPLVSQATNPDAAVLSNFTLEPNGAVAFHYSPKEVAPLDRGAISILVPRDVFAAWLNREGRAAMR